MSRSADNSLYDRLADTWWAEQGVLGILRTAVNPARSGYFRRVLEEAFGAGSGARGLDVGCGGGILTEDLARAGLAVSGLDQSGPSLSAARRHAAAEQLRIPYIRGSAEALPFRDNGFEFVCCCDVLEHVADPARVVAEAARVLRPGGLFFYDTVNRTCKSRIVAVGFAQRWRWSRFLPEGVHAWAQFVKPRELRRLLVQHELEHRELLGMAPAAHPLRIALLARRLHRGLLGFEAFGRALRYQLGRDTSVSYLGYAVKQRS